MKNNISDITIVGGGLVGTTLAIALQKSNLDITLIEAFDPSSHQQALKDMRSIALNTQSQKIFERLGVWEEMAEHATPLKKIHISEKNCFGNTLLDAQEMGLDSFGAVIPIPYLYNILQKKLENITLLRPAKVTALSQHNDYWELDVNNQKIKATLLIAADGDRSFIREYLKLPVEKTDFQQQAIVTTLLASKPHKNIAYERFTKDGVLALLPLQNNRVACIWTTENNKVEHIKNNILDITQQSIGYRLGKLSDPATIQTYPLHELSAEIQSLPQFILLGNAAHVLHPIAAQGLNLSLRDVDVLSELIIHKKDLSDYQVLREKDQHQTAEFTHNLVKLFTPQGFCLPALRAKGLLIFDLFPRIKKLFSQRRMGMVDTV